jgi:peptide-methionine (S)-S-oxide reductase
MKRMRTLLLALGAALGLLGPAAAQTGAPPPVQTAARTAVFAGGCFWCTEADFEKLPGVITAVSGYTGGSKPEPTYKEVTAGRTGHYEAVQVTYDPAQVSYGALLTYFWRTIDPTQGDGQFCDRGASYRTAVFVADAAERRAAETSRQLTERRLGQRIVTEILPAGRFWPAEDYHQDYARKNPLRYATYRKGCGRDARLKALWGGR